MIFEWDDKKNKANQKKHDVSFEEGRTIFYDPNVLTKPDPDHSEQEERWLSIGISENLRALLVVQGVRAFRGVSFDLRTHPP